jgi:hypothetical protein
MGKRLVQVHRLGVVAAAALGLLAACGGGSDNAAAPDTGPVAAGLACDESMKTAFKPDANTTVLQVKQVKKGDPYPGATPAQISSANPSVFNADLCWVKLLVGPGNPGPADAPSTSKGIGIELWLPDKAAWTQRIHAIGTTGWATGGNETILDRMKTDFTHTGPDTVANRPRDSAARVAGEQGAVTSTTDSGIQSNTGGSFALNPDRSHNAAGWHDWTYRSLYEQAVKTKALAAAYYGKPAKYSYFSGLSGGARQALHVAQNLPEQYDGILSTFPSSDWSSLITAVYPALVAMRELGGQDMSTAQLNLVSRAAVAACDMVGGQHLGFILDINSCRYDPTKDSSVLCRADGGVNDTAACLTPKQALVMNKIWYGLTVDGSVPDPAVDNGFDTRPLAVRQWYGVPRGTNFASLLNPGSWGGGPGVGRDVLAIALQDPSLGNPSFVNATGNGQEGWKNFTYAQLSDAFQKFKDLNAVYGFNANNPDLTRLRTKGTKLLHTTGVYDASVWLQGHTDYFDRVAERMGGVTAVQDFYKLYTMPGLAHGNGNGSANREANPPSMAYYQTYQALVDWVEKGISPDAMVFSARTGPAAAPDMSLPACAYPKKATYVSGDVRTAASYVCK